MKKLDRREFLQTSLAGLAGLSLLGTGTIVKGCSTPSGSFIDTVRLGNSGLTVPRLALGTGSHGGGKASNQTRLGTEGFVSLAHYAFDRGIQFFDMADSYGSHPYVKAALRELPREKTTLLTKIWTEDTRWYQTEPVAKTLDRFRLETGSDYFDIVLMHCLMRPNWTVEKRGMMDEFSRAKEDGIIKVLGVSCHNWDAMVEAVDEPWVDVILARINPFGVHMDNTPDTVMDLLKRAHDNGKGIIGMKIFGNGDKVTEEEREMSIRYALQSGNVDCLTLGLESPAQIDDAIERVMRNVAG